MELATFKADGFRSVSASSSKDAAVTFGNRLARRELGKRGECINVRQDSWSEDGSYSTFQLMIGLPSKSGGFDFRNEWITVRKG
jgi:hypothetical protein